MGLINLVARVIGKLLFLLILALIVVFCLNNHQQVELSLLPLPFIIETRMFFVVLFCFVSGVLLGSFSIYLTLGKTKFLKLLDEQKIKSLQKKLDKQKEKTAAAKEKARVQIEASSQEG